MKVVDCGAALSVVCPVHDGYVLQKALVKNLIAGDRISEELLKVLLANKTKNKKNSNSVQFFRKKSLEIRPLYSIARKEVERGKIEVTIKDFPKTTESYRNFQILVRGLRPSPSCYHAR